MRVTRNVLSAVFATTVLAGAASLAAPTQAQGYWRGDYEGRGRSAAELIQREDRLQSWARRLEDNGRLQGWRARRVEDTLSGVRRWTWRESRVHGGYLPDDDYQAISSRLEQVASFIRQSSEDEND